MYAHRHYSIFILFGAVITFSIFYLLQINEQVLAQHAAGHRISWGQVLSNDIATKKIALQNLWHELPGLVRASKTAPDDIGEGNLNSIVKALELYQLDHNQYPTRLTELVPTYLDRLPNTTTTMSYELTTTGYILSITLPSGKIITRTP